MADAAGWLLAIAWLAALGGCAWFALSREWHWRRVHARPGPSRVQRDRLRRAGLFALLVSLGLCLAADHPSMAVLVWVMLLAAGATGVALVLAWRPAWLRRAWPAGAADADTRRPAHPVACVLSELALDEHAVVKDVNAPAAMPELGALARRDRLPDRRGG